MEHGHIQGLPKFMRCPQLSQEQSYELRIWPEHLQAQSEQKPIKNFWRQGGMGVSRDCPIFWIPPIISRTGKAKFCTHIHRINRNKSPLKISRKVTVGVLRNSRKFWGHATIYNRAHRAVIFVIAQLSCLRLQLRDCFCVVAVCYVLCVIACYSVTWTII